MIFHQIPRLGGRLRADGVDDDRHADGDDLQRPARDVARRLRARLVTSTRLKRAKDMSGASTYTAGAGLMRGMPYAIIE
ncbi:MAG: hypothetical protein SGJ17_06555 [Hyphomicrobiales bacterium]|nr:hypothetical protein [Hyphomicrobiales bacterium]